MYGTWREKGREGVSKKSVDGIPEYWLAGWQGGSSGFAYNNSEYTFASILS